MPAPSFQPRLNGRNQDAFPSRCVQKRTSLDEEADVERPLRLVAAVAELADDGEAVLLEALLRPRVPGRRRTVEQVQVVRAVPDAVTQDVDGAAPGDLALEPGQKFPSRRTVVVQDQRFRRLRLSRAQERPELDEVDAIVAVVVVGTARRPACAAVGGAGLRDPAFLRRIAGMAGQPRADEAFEAALGGVGGYRCLPCSRNGLITRRPS